MIVLFLAGTSQAQKLGEPKLVPTPSTPSQEILIKQGIALHDRGNYDGAIKYYEEALAGNPNNVFALYELAFSYFQKRDFQKSLELGYKLAQYKSDFLPRVYVLIGNSQDELGEVKKAIETYKAGIKLFPTSFLIHFNLAITYNKLGELDEARASAKKSAGFNPQHSSSQLLLALLFDRGGYKTPALLAVCRFLVLEPNSQRSASAIELMHRIMQGGVTARKNSNEIKITLDANAKKDEGDFGATDLAIGLVKAAEKTEKNQGKSPMQLLAGNLETTFAIIGEQKGDRSQFTWRYYVPYFDEMKKQGHVEAFVYYSHQLNDSADVGEWLNQNRGKVESFLAWSKSYPWPKMD